MAPSGAINNSSTSGSKIVSGNGTIESGGTIRGGGARASINMWGPLPAFNLIVQFFNELWQNYPRG